VDSSNHFLYHGTLRRNLPSIRDTGLRPQRGAWGSRFHAGDCFLVHAVNDEHRGALIVAIAGQMKIARLALQSANYSFDDFKNDLLEHGAVVVVKATTFSHHPSCSESVHAEATHPTGAEPGTWYSSEAVSIESEMTGKEMLAWLSPNEEDFRYRFRDVLLGDETPKTGGDR
jgi:hypothetical protein